MPHSAARGGGLTGFSSCRHPQVAPCYPHEVQGFAAEVGGLLEDQATALDSSTRLALVSCHGSMQASVSADAGRTRCPCRTVALVVRSLQKSARFCCS